VFQGANENVTAAFAGTLAFNADAPDPTRTVIALEPVL
jgi:hypothetical protein